MNKFKISAIALSSALIFGCGSSNDESASNSTNQTGTFTNLLKDGYWEFGSANPASSDDLPNVYVLDGNNITYYYDDDDLGTYTAYPVSFNDNSAGTFTFDFYENSITPTETTVNYSISTSGVLTIVTELNDLIAYEDHASDSEVRAAVAAAINGTSNENNEEEEEDTVTYVTYSEDFESYSVGALISDASNDWNTLKVVDDANGMTTAEISNAEANGGVNSLLLLDENSDVKPYVYHLFENGAQAEGSVSVDVYLDGGNAARTFIQVGSDTWDANRYFQLRLNTALKYEAGEVDIELATLTQDEWHTIEMSWTDAGIFTITLDGVVVGENIDQTSTGLAEVSAPTHLVLYTGSGAAIGNKAYVDNILLTFPVGDDVVAEAAEDFESYVLGETLSAPWELFGTSTDSVVTVVADDAAGGNQAMEIYDGDTEKPYAVLALSDYFSQGSASFYLNAASSNTQPCYAAISNDHWNSGRVMEMKVTTSGSVYYEAGDSDVKVGIVNLDTWNKFEIIWNDGAFTLKVNGDALATDITQEQTGLVEVEAGIIKFMAGNLMDSGTRCRIDHIASEQL